jgi:DNA adenine methylase
MAHLQLCHYPGCKAKVRAKILPFLLPLAQHVDVFVDVFAGAGGIALELMFQRPDLVHVVNDADPTVIALWLAVRDQPDQLIRQIESFTPNLDDFDLFRRHLRRVAQLPLSERPHELLELGFRRLAYQAMSHSGRAVGGPRGGRAQFDNWVGQKWWPSRIASIIRLSTDRMRLPREFQITNRDFIPIIGDTTQQMALFCDPPYVPDNPEWPERYYRHDFSHADHARLAEMLRLTSHFWVLTYGDHLRVRALYDGWARIERLGERELLIMPKGVPA